MERIVFVTFGNLPQYTEIQQPLVDSIKKYTPYDILQFKTFEEIGSPPHAVSPYEFKIHAILEAKRRGYTIVIWCDSPFRLIRPVDTLIPKIEKCGVYIQQDGWAVGQWANDKSLAYFNLSRDEVLTIPNASAGIMGFDFSKVVATVFLEKLLGCAREGLFFGKWNNNDKTESEDPRCLGHRHDQTCVELVAYQMGIEKQPLIWGGENNKERYFTSWDKP